MNEWATELVRCTDPAEDTNSVSDIMQYKPWNEPQPGSPEVSFALAYQENFVTNQVTKPFL